MKHEEKKGRVSVSYETPPWPNIYATFKGEERDGDKISKLELKSHFQDIFLLSRFITNLHN